jgi:hypothetical protein
MLNTVDTFATMPRGLTEKEASTITALAGELPGRFTAKTERNADGQLYVGLVAPQIDSRAVPVLIGGVQGGGLLVEDWTGSVLAEGVGMDAAFAAIREALPPRGW